MENEELIEKAKSVAKENRLNKLCTSGEVGAALVTDKGNTYIGNSLGCACGMGWCGERSAIASMISHGESRIKTIVAVGTDGTPLAPCGICREMMMQINIENKDTDVILSGKTVKLSGLLPEFWFNENK